MNQSMSYGAWLRSRRQRAGFTQESLGLAAGIGRIYVNLIENGKVKLPTKPTRDKVHSVLNTDDHELIEIGVLELDRFGNAVASDTTPKEAA